MSTHSDQRVYVSPEALDIITHGVNAFVNDGRVPIGQDDGLAVILALWHIEQYYHAAVRSFERWRTVSTFVRSNLAQRPEWHPNHLLAERNEVATELHAYLTAWRMIDRHIEVLKKRTRRLGMVSVLHTWRQHKIALEDHKRLRNHIEHVDSELPGAAGGADRQFRVWISGPNDKPEATLGWVVAPDGTLTIGTTTIHVGPDLDELKIIVDDLLAALIDECRQKIRENDYQSLNS